MNYVAEFVRETFIYHSNHARISSYKEDTWNNVFLRELRLKTRKIQDGYDWNDFDHSTVRTRITMEVK